MHILKWYRRQIIDWVVRWLAYCVQFTWRNTHHIKFGSLYGKDIMTLYIIQQLQKRNTHFKVILTNNTTKVAFAGELRFDLRNCKNINRMISWSHHILFCSVGETMFFSRRLTITVTSQELHGVSNLPKLDSFVESVFSRKKYQHSSLLTLYKGYSLVSGFFRKCPVM